MADHSKPTTTSTYTNFVTELDGRFDDLSLGLDPANTTATNLPTNSIRWASGSYKWQKYDGSTWNDLSSYYAININGTVGATTPSSGAFTTLSSTGNTTLGDASADTITFNGTVQPGVVIAGLSASDAVRITQTGSGNALLVEDSANPDSTPFVIDTSGNVVVGATTANTKFETVGSALLANGTAALNAVTTPTYNGLWVAYDSTNNLTALQAVNSAAAGMVFHTKSASGSATAERMRITSAGDVGIGNTPSGIYKLEVTGKTYASGGFTPRVSTTTSSATPTINTDNFDQYGLTAQAVDITSFTTNLSGTPVNGQKLWIYIIGTAARAITWGASFESSTIPLPTTTVTTNRLDVGFVWNASTSKWRCVATS